MRLAHELHMTEREVLLMTPDEFGRWMAYFKIVDEAEKKAAAAAKRKRGK